VSGRVARIEWKEVQACELVVHQGKVALRAEVPVRVLRSKWEGLKD